MKISTDLNPETKSFVEITKRKNGTTQIRTHNVDPSLTDPQWSEESDINYIMQKFQKTGQLTWLSKNQGVYADVSEIPNLLDASIIVRDSQLKFDALPAEVREKFKNNPQNMIDYLQEPRNYEEAVQLGLLSKKAKNDDSNDESNANKKRAEPKPSPKVPETKE